MVKLVIIFLVSLSCFAADFSPFIGQWRGDCQNGEQQFEMELLVEKENSLKYSWIIIYYLEGSAQKRAYTLLIDKKLGGQFIIDENNGLLLQGKLVDNIMYQLFHLKSGPIIIPRYEAGESFIKVEMPTYDRRNPQSSTTTDLQNTVYSYEFTGIQKCLLLKS